MKIRDDANASTVAVGAGLAYDAQAQRKNNTSCSNNMQAGNEQ